MAAEVGGNDDPRRLDSAVDSDQLVVQDRKADASLDEALEGAERVAGGVRQLVVGRQARAENVAS